MAVIANADDLVGLRTVANELRAADDGGFALAVGGAEFG